jgi:hypothetical protein
MIVLTRRLTMRPTPVPVQVLEEFSGRGDHPIGTELEMAEPGIEDFAELSEPSFDELIHSLEGLLAQEHPSLDTQGLEAMSGEAGGDRREAGPLGSSDVIPRPERWDVAYSGTTLQSYAAQLAFFGIELAVIGGGQSGIDYVWDLDQPTLRVRHVDQTEQEQRLYFTWRSGQLQQFDRQLVERAGVSLVGRRIVQFYPEPVENLLATLEQQALNGRALRTVRKTRFGVRPSGEGFEYFVVGIEWRTGL